MSLKPIGHAASVNESLGGCLIQNPECPCNPQAYLFRDPAPIPFIDNEELRARSSGKLDRLAFSSV